MRHAFPDKLGRPRTHIIRSTSTNDLKIANARAEEWKTELRRDFDRIRRGHTHNGLNDFLRGLYGSELSSFRRALDDPSQLEERFAPPAVAAQRRALAAGTRNAQGAALVSGDFKERLAVAGWAADDYFLSVGRAPDRSSPEYVEVLDQCALVLADGVRSVDELARGRPEPTPLSVVLKGLREDAAQHSNALAPEGRLPLSTYFNTIYAPHETREGAPVKGERNIGGKRHSVRLFSELIADKPICAITRGDLFDFLAKLEVYPESRRLTGPLKKMKASVVLAKVKAGEVVLPAMHPKTANKHISNLSAVFKFAERRRHMNAVDSKGVKAQFEDHEDAGRPFTTDELNRLFSLPIFAGCAGERVEGGLFKPGPILVRDDRFWIPMVLLFTGARVAEIVGLRTSEVEIDHEVPHFVITQTETRRIKNRHSRRMVPIHSRLLAMGFEDFVRRRIRERSERLFPMAEQTTYREGATGHVVKRALSQSLIVRQFNRTLVLHAQAEGASAKSFRNTFEQESASKIDSDEVKQRLTGRKVMSTIRIYTDNIPRDPHQRSVQLRRLKGEIERITYDAVKLDHLQAPKS